MVMRSKFYTTATAIVFGLAAAGVTVPAFAGGNKAYYGQQTTQVAPDHARSVSGQQHAPNIETGQTPMRGTTYETHMRTTQTAPDHARSISGQHHAPTVERAPQPQPKPVTYNQEPAAAAPVQQTATSACENGNPGAIRPVTDNSGGEPGTRALNYLMAAGFTQYENFRQQGDRWAAEVMHNCEEQTVLVDPNDGDMTFQES